MNQLIRCRCGRWTTYGLACTSCKSASLGHISSDDGVDEIEEDVPEELPEEETEKIN